MEDRREVDSSARRVGVLVRAGKTELRTTAMLQRHENGSGTLSDFHLAKSGRVVDQPFPQGCDFLIERGVIVPGDVTVRHCGEVRTLKRLSRAQRRRLGIR